MISAIALLILFAGLFRVAYNQTLSEDELLDELIGVKK